MKHQPTQGLDVVRYREGAAGQVRDHMAVEERVAIYIGGREAAVLMASPGDECELGLGFAITMGWLSPAGTAPACGFQTEARVISLAADAAAPPESGPRASGGGGLGPLAAPRPPDDFRMPIDTARRLTKQMSQHQRLFAMAGATHSAAVFDAAGELISIKEDIGRHNAMDKAVGAAWAAGDLARARAMAISGRASLEMVLKAARAGMAILVSVSAPSYQGAVKARETGMTLLGFSRVGRVNVYSHPHRVGL